MPGSTGEPGRRRGPRTGGDTRADIVEAARRLFGEQGYAGTSLRAVAREAGVDPSLVHHYFAGKAQLFALTMGLDVDPRALVAPVLSHPREEVPAAIVATVLAFWEDQVGGDRVVGLLRTLTDGTHAGDAFGQFLTERVLGPITTELGVDRPQRRAALMASQIVGLGVVRFVLRLEPLASADRASLVADLAPTLHRYLYGELPEPS